MATLRILSNRLKSVKNIQKITKSMKMVSAAKFSRAERELKESKPLGEGTQVFFEKAGLSVIKEDVDQDSRKLLIAISSDRGLCGSVHSQVSKAVKAELGLTPGNTTSIICVGDKSRILLQSSYAKNIAFVVNDIGRRPPTFLDASKIAQKIATYNFSRAKIMFNKFKSIVSYTVENITLFSESSVMNAPQCVVYDSLDNEILQNYLEFSLVSMLYYSLKENNCSEQASRMSAMDNATKNAGEMINGLTLRLNRTRQAVITRELIEIISGASALE